MKELSTQASLKIVQPNIEMQYQLDGFNIGINVGLMAGQSIFHVHLHLIPRYQGDVENPRGGVRDVIPARQNY